MGRLSVTKTLGGSQAWSSGALGTQAPTIEMNDPIVLRTSNSVCLLCTDPIVVYILLSVTYVIGHVHEIAGWVPVNSEPGICTKSSQVDVSKTHHQSQWI